MLKVFSGSCLSLEDMDVIRRPRIVEQPHVLGPGTDFFTEDGRPVRPQPSAHTIHKVFSGSALDLNAMQSIEDEEVTPRTPPPAAPLATTVSTILSQVTTESEKERSKFSKSKTTVLVIGGNGYLSSHIVAKLLDAGYTVRVTVADELDNQQQIELYSMVPEAGHRLTISEADVTKASSFRDVIPGCKYVVHCGVSPSAVRDRDIVLAHMDAVQALFDAIRFNGKSSVKRVILTGSASAVLNVQDPIPASGKFDESCWNTKATALADPFAFAKLSFEREAWRLKKMFGTELMVILPSIVIGPSLTHETSEAMCTLVDLASGSPLFPFAPNMNWNFVDVRDVADAHIRAMEHPDLKDERLIVSNQCLSLSEVGRMIKASHPHLHPPTRSAPFWLTLLIAPLVHARVRISFLWRNLGVRRVLDSSKAKRELGLELTPIETTVRDSIDELIRTGMLPPAVPPRTGTAAGATAAQPASSPLSKRWCAAAAVTAVGVALGIAALRFNNKKK